MIVSYKIFEKLANIDLQHEYDELNKLLFNGELERVPLKWSTISSGGRVVYDLNHVTNKYDIRHLEISKKYDIEYNIFRDLLAHEMIHVYIHQKNIKEYGGSHGIMFQNKMDEINNMKLGFNITLKHDVFNIKISDSVSMKKYAYVILKRTFGEKDDVSIGIISNEKEYMNNIDEYIEKSKRIQKYTNKKYLIHFLKSNNSQLKKFPFATKYKTMNLYYMSEELYNELLESTPKEDIIKEVKIG